MITDIKHHRGYQTTTYQGLDYYGEAGEQSHYAVGHRDAHYPVPAISIGWEIGLCLNDNQYVWLFWERGAYDA